LVGEFGDIGSQGGTGGLLPASVHEFVHLSEKSKTFNKNGLLMV
jgi:hypothetical protein